MKTSTRPGMELETKTSTEPEFRLVLPSRAENVSIVRHALGGAVEVLELSESRVLDIKAAVSEACNNVVVHAYEDGEGPMEVYLCFGENELEVMVSDQGAGIRPKRLQSELALQGLGLSLIQSLSDRVGFLGGAGKGTKVRMAFALDASVPEEWIRDLPDSQHEVKPPPGEMIVAVSSGPLAAPVLGRVIAMLAARAGFSLEGISEAQLVTDSLAAHAPRVIVGEKIQLGIDPDGDRLLVRAGPLEDGGAQRVLESSALGNLPPVFERLTRDQRVESSKDGELLCLTLVNPH
jgi:serine/threonine-protein kinase RsbW